MCFFVMNDGFLGWVGQVICHFGFPIIYGLYFLPAKKVVRNSVSMILLTE